MLVLGIGLWEGLVAALDVQRFLLPPPSDIARTFWDERHALWSAGWYTFKEALGGFLIGCSAGIVVAIMLARWRGLSAAIMPYAIAANAVPIIAFAPITNQWFGVLNPLSKMAIAAVLCFFPVLTNMLRGLTSVHPSSIELMRSYAAGEVEIFRRVRIPNSLPFLFSALKVASVLAMIGAVVGEYFGGTTGGARRPDPQFCGALRVRDGLGRDPRREHPRHHLLSGDRAPRTPDHGMASVRTSGGVTKGEG